MLKGRIGCASAMLLVLLSADRAEAQANYRSSPIGGRTTLMGGAGIADGRDGAAPFLNPATVVRVDEGRLTFAVNFYTLSIRSSPRWFRPGPVDTATFGAIGDGETSMSDASFDALPSSLCLFFKAGEGLLRRPLPKDALGRDPRLAVCFATTQGEELDFANETHELATGAGITRHAQTVSHEYSRFAIGPTYAMHVTDAFAVGASLHASLVSHRSLFSSSATTTRTAGAPIRSLFWSGSRGTSFQANGILGATYRFGKETVGIALETPSLHLFGSGGANRDVHFDGAGTFRSSSTGEGSFESRTPMRVGIGSAVVDTWGAAEIDFSYYAPLDPAYRAELRGRTVEDSGGGVSDRPATFDESAPARGIMSASVGAEVFLTRSLSVLGGLSTDLSAARKDSLGGPRLFDYFQGRQSRVAASFGVGSHGSEGDLLFGAEVSYASGHRLAVDPYRLPSALTATPQDTVRVLLVVAGSTSFRAIRRAVKDVEEVLPLRKSKP